MIVASNNNGLVAVVTTIGYARLSVPIYSEGVLQSTLTCPLPSNDTNNQDVTLRKLVFSNNNSQYLCAHLSNNVVVVWNVTRGVVIHKNLVSNNKTDVGVLDMVSSVDGRTLFVMVLQQQSSSSSHKNGGAAVAKKLYVNEYSLESGKILRKIKAGKVQDDETTTTTTTSSMELLGSLAVSTNFVAVRTCRQIVKVMKIQDGQRVSKIKLNDNHHHNNHSSNGSGGMVLALWEENPHRVVVASGTLSNVLVHQCGPTKSTQLATLAVPEPPHYLELVQGNNDELVLLVQLANNNNNSATLYKVPNTSSNKDASSSSSLLTNPLCSMETSTDIRNARFHLQPHHQCVLGILQTTNSIEIATRSYLDEESGDYLEKVEFGTQEQEDNDDDNDDDKKDSIMGGGNKRKMSMVASVLGPGQAGTEAVHVRDCVPLKKAKTKESLSPTKETETEDTQGPSIAERLSKLAKAFEEEEQEEMDDDDDDDMEDSRATMTSKTVTTESLSSLLQQALSSGDESMLELALKVSPSSLSSSSLMIATSVQDLALDHPDLIGSLLTQLTVRLARRPTRAHQLLPWFQQVLPRVRSTQHLVPLKNLLQERVETLPSLLQLEGRLSMLANL